jgi:hypothetical protein
LPVGEPLGAREPLALWAMPVAAGVVGAAHQAAILAKFRVAAERRSSARCDGAHDTALGAAEMLGMHLAVGVAMAAEDLRHLQPGRHDGGSGWLSDLQLEAGRAGFACCRAEAVGDFAAIEVDTELPFLHIDARHDAEIAVVDVLVVVVLDLHDLVARTEGPAEPIDADLARRVQRLLQFYIEGARTEAGRSRWAQAGCTSPSPLKAWRDDAPIAAFETVRDQA